MRVLIVEDEAKLAALVRRGLTGYGFAADIAPTGQDALWMADAVAYDLVVLDVMLADISGLQVCQELRDAGSAVAILMLTALGTVADRVDGLNGGADDYLPKPFNFAELVARLHALARRGATSRPSVVAIGDLALDPAAHTVRRGDVGIELTATEFALLETLMRCPGQALTRFELLESVWDEAYENRSNIIDVYIRYLRRKIDKPFGTASLQTVRGVGYRLEASGRG